MAKRSAYGRHEEFRLVKAMTESGHRFFSVFAKMSDGKWLKRSGQTWKVASFKVDIAIDPETKLIELGYKKMDEREYRLLLREAR